MTAPTPLFSPDSDHAGPALSHRVRQLKPSVTVAVANRAKEMKRAGLDVLGFAAGEPDFNTPEPIKQAAIDALHANQTRYMPTLGDPETRGVIAEKLTKENSLPGVTADHIAISTGGKHGLFIACHCLLDPPAPGSPQQEVLLPVPAWVSYRPIIEMAGAKVVEIPTTDANGFKMTPEQLKAAITPQSRMLILNTPSNPCGTMYTPDELKAIAAVVADAARSTAPELVVFTDELYEKITYGGIEHYSIGATPSIAERTVTLNGLSKAYAMTGWRIGYTAASGEWGKRLIKSMGTMQGQMTTNITSFNFPAIRVALTDCAAEVEEFRKAFARRAELIHALLSEIRGVRATKSTGAFYAFPNIAEHFGATSAGGRTIGCALDFAEALLEEKLVAVVPGEDFGGCGDEHIRISFACSEEQIARGMARLAEFVDGLT
ncbi:MAG: pyridoxal phosphate-dependent aminotransferase [Planctomycetota bacterium]